MQSPTVYALIDPRTGKIRYVGQTTLSLQHRLTNHLSDARTRNKPMQLVHDWISELTEQGLEPEIAELPYDTENDAIFRLGLDNLLNQRKGGAGRPPVLTWTKAMDALLGSLSDIELAKRWAVSYSTVARRRAVLGIPAITER